MVFNLPKLYPITDRRISGLSHADQVRKLARGGATLIQLREKEAASGDFLAMAHDAVSAAKELGVKIVINDRVDIALLSGAAGVHVGQNDLPPAAAREILGCDTIIGFSTNTVEQAAEAVRLPIDYIAIGPVFCTKTKPDADPTVGLKTVADVRRAIGRSTLVAIGGITGDRIAEVLGAGADSAALISALYPKDIDIADNFSSLLSRTQNIA